MATPTDTTPVRKLDERELRAFRGLLCTHATLVKALDAELIREHDLPLSSYEVLMWVSDAPDGRMRMHDIADRVMLSRSGLTRLVDRLVRDGLLRREACPDDARGAYAVITPEGRALREQAQATHHAGIRRLFLDHLSADDQDEIGRLFDLVLAGDLEDLRGSCPSGG